jgi:hypothetical protein
MGEVTGGAAISRVTQQSMNLSGPGQTAFLYLLLDAQQGKEQRSAPLGLSHPGRSHLHAFSCLTGFVQLRLAASVSSQQFLICFHWKGLQRVGEPLSTLLDRVLGSLRCWVPPERPDVEEDAKPADTRHHDRYDHIGSRLPGSDVNQLAEDQEQVERHSEEP